MGANLQTRTLKDMPLPKLCAKWEAMVEESRNERGTSYSGDIGMLRGRPSFKALSQDSQRAASDLIADQHDKGCPPLAVSFMDKGVKYWEIGGWCSE
jgi:hypothetical protein